MLTGEACEGCTGGPVRLQKKRGIKSSTPGESVEGNSTNYIESQW